MPISTAPKPARFPATGTRTSGSTKNVSFRLGYKGTKRYVQVFKLSSTVTAAPPVAASVLLLDPDQIAPSSKGPGFGGRPAISRPFPAFPSGRGNFMALMSGERQVAPTIDGIRRDHVARYNGRQRCSRRAVMSSIMAAGSAMALDPGRGWAYGRRGRPGR
jgi:hypothetical protein